MKSSLAAPKLAVEANAGCRGAGFSIYRDRFRNDANRNESSAFVPDKRFGAING
jgi:hypothetical protein